MVFGWYFADFVLLLPKTCWFCQIFTIDGKSRVRFPSGPPMVKNRRFVLAEMLRREKHSDQRVIVRCNELHEVAPVTAGATLFNLLRFGVGIKQLEKVIAKMLFKLSHLGWCYLIPKSIKAGFLRSITLGPPKDHI